MLRKVDSRGPDLMLRKTLATGDVPGPHTLRDAAAPSFPEFLVGGAGSELTPLASAPRALRCAHRLRLRWLRTTGSSSGRHAAAPRAPRGLAAPRSPWISL